MSTPPLEIFKYFAQPANENITNIADNTLAWKRKLRQSPFAIKIWVEAGGQEIKFTYNITKYERRTLEIQLNFTDPIKIGARDDLDYIYVSFPAYFYLFDMSGQFMKFPEIELRHYLPQQMKLGSLQTQFLTTLTQTANQVTTATLSANTIVNLLLQGALN